LARPRKNGENDGLPKGWRWKLGTYRYRVPKAQRHLWDGKTEFRLGVTLSEAHQIFAGRLARQEGAIQTFNNLIDRFLIDVTANRKPQTKQGEMDRLERLRHEIGHNRVDNFRARHAYQLRDAIHHSVDRRKGTGETTANRHMETVSFLLTKACEWGVIDIHPMIQAGYKKLPTHSKLRIPTYEEVLEALKLATPLIRCYVTLKLLTGLRQTSMMYLQRHNLTKEGIQVMIKKTEDSTKMTLLFTWTPELEQVIEDIKKLPQRSSMYFFRKYNGECLINSDNPMDTKGWKKMWQRWQYKLPKEKRFTERSLRNLVGAESSTLAEAKERLGHASESTTRKFYPVKAVRITPLVIEKE